MYSVYVDVKPCGTPFYVGKGNARRVALAARSKNAHHGNVCKKYPDWERLVLFEFLDEQMALDKERDLIAHFGRKENGGILVNLTDSGPATAGYKHTEESKEIIRTTSKARMASKEARAKVSTTFKGKARGPRTPEVRAKLSEALKNSEKAKAARIELSIAMTGKKNKPHSLETRAKMSASLKGRPSPYKGVPRSAEARAKMSTAQTGKKWTDERRARASESRKGRPAHNKGVPCPPEMRARISATLKARNLTATQASNN